MDSLWVEFGRVILTATLAVAGSALTFKYKFSREFRTKKRAEFLERQLSEFYGPMKMLHREIRVLSDTRVRELRAFHEHADPQNPRHDQRHANLITKHNKELQTLIIPAYEKMKTLISAKSHLAEPEIIAGYDNFYRFVKGWQDHLEKPIGSRFNFKAAMELAEEMLEPIEYFALVEKQFEEKRTEYTSLFK